MGMIYIDNAIKSGATAIICETIPENHNNKIAWIRTKDSAKALGLAASNFFGNPSSSLKLVGVTGTNGKTTIATLLYKMFTGLGYKCGLFSTVCNYINEKNFLQRIPLPIRFSLTGSWQKWLKPDATMHLWK